MAGAECYYSSIALLIQLGFLCVSMSTLERRSYCFNVVSYALLHISIERIYAVAANLNYHAASTIALAYE